MAQGGARCVGEFLRCAVLHDVDLDDSRGNAAGCGDFFRQIIQQVFAARGDAQLDALGGKHFGDAAADALAGAGDECGFALQLQVH